MEATLSAETGFFSSFFKKTLSQKLRNTLESAKDSGLKPAEISEKFLREEGYRDFSVSYKLQGDSSEVLSISINDTDEKFMISREPGEKWKKLSF